MKCGLLLLISCFLCPHILQGGVGQLETLIDGVSSPNVESFPVGVNVTYICNVDATSHRWNIPALSITRSILFGDLPAVDPPFMIRVMSLNGNTISSSLSFKTYIGLNGTTVSCADPLNTEIQEATVIVVGDVPELIATVSGVLRNGSEFCLGETVTFVCDIVATNHLWSFSSLGMSRAVTSSSPLSTVGPFTLEVVSIDNTVVTTSATFVINGDLNNTEISCINVDTQGSQVTNVTIPGAPSAPSFQFIIGDFQLQVFFFTIVPPSYGSLCVHEYSIDPSGGPTDIQPFTMPISPDSDGLVRFQRGGFDLCRETYNFTATAISTQGPSEPSAMFAQGEVDFHSPSVSVSNSGFNISLSWEAPTLRGYNVSISRTDHTSQTCVQEMDNLTVPEQEPTTTRQFQLGCNYAGMNVTFCVQFGFFLCQSITTKMRSPQLPNLTSTEQIQSPSSIALSLQVVSLMEDLLVNCDEADQYRLEVNVSGADGRIVVSRRFSQLNSSQQIDFQSVPAGEYTCTTSVIASDNSIVQTQSMTCLSSGPPAPGTASTNVPVFIIVGVLVPAAIIILGIIIVLIGVLTVKRTRARRLATLGRPNNRDPVPDGVPYYEEITPVSHNRYNSDVILLESNKAYGQIDRYR